MFRIRPIHDDVRPVNQEAIRLVMRGGKLVKGEW